MRQSTHWLDYSFSPLQDIQPSSRHINFGDLIYCLLGILGFASDVFWPYCLRLNRKALDIFGYLDFTFLLRPSFLFACKILASTMCFVVFHCFSFFLVGFFVWFFRCAARVRLPNMNMSAVEISVVGGAWGRLASGAGRSLGKKSRFFGFMFVLFFSCFSWFVVFSWDCSCFSCFFSCCCICSRFSWAGMFFCFLNHVHSWK